MVRALPRLLTRARSGGGAAAGGGQRGGGAAGRAGGAGARAPFPTRSQAHPPYQAALLDHQQTACLRTDQAAAQHSSPAPTRAPLPSAAPSRRRPRPRRRSSSGSEAGEEAERGAATSEAPPVPPVSDDPWACLEAPPVQTLQPVQAVRRVPVILPALQEKGSTGGGWRQLKRGREAREE